MNRMVRIRRFNSSSKANQPFDILYPQSITNNILRREDGGVLESYLHDYDRHLVDQRHHFVRGESYGDGRRLCVDVPHVVLVDRLPLLLTLHVDVECEPTLSYNGSDPYPIVNGNGERVPGGQIEGSIIFVVFNARRKEWILMSTSEFSDVTRTALPVTSTYNYEAVADDERVFVIPGYDRTSDKLRINYGQTILRYGLDYDYVYTTTNAIRLINFGLPKGDILQFEITKFEVVATRRIMKYELFSRDYPVTITEDDTTVVHIPPEGYDCYKVDVNYHQTILRWGIDYDFNEARTEITLMNGIKIPKDDVIVFHIEKFVETNGEVVPNNFGATGNYRYKIGVIHSEFESEEDAVYVVPVPQFNPKRDDLAVVRDNHLLVQDVDYAIDEIGNVVLLGDPLNTGDHLYYTIMQGAMVDVPDFNVIKATGQSGQHILLDFSYSILCDFYVLLVQLKHDLLTAPTAKCIDGPAEPILDCFGNPVLGGYKAGSYIWLVYNYDKHTWYSLSHSQLDISQLIPSNIVVTGEANFTGIQPEDIELNRIRETVVEHNLGRKPESIEVTPCEPPNVVDGVMTNIGDIWAYSDENKLYVGNSGTATSKFRWKVSTSDTVQDLRSYLMQELEVIRNTPGKIVTVPYVYTAKADGENAILNIPDYMPGIDKILVNFGQTILRTGIDFNIDTTNKGIVLTQIKLKTGDIIQCTVLKQVEPE